MSTSHRVFSDIFDLKHFVRQVAVSQGKNLIIDTLRETFKDDTFYKFVTDAWGYPQTPDLTDLPPDISEERTTRIFIGDIYRYDKRYLPAITVRQTGGRYYAISFSQNETYRYRVDLVIDGYGNRSLVKVPTHQVFAGAWNQTFEVQVAAESTPDREELADIVAGVLQASERLAVQDAGLFIRNVSFGGEREDEWGNEKIYIQSINVETFSEWRRELPISDIVETINFCFNYGVLGGTSDINDVSIITTEDAVEIEWGS